MGYQFPRLVSMFQLVWCDVRGLLGTLKNRQKEEKDSKKVSEKRKRGNGPLPVLLSNLIPSVPVSESVVEGTRRRRRRRRRRQTWISPT